MLRCRRQELVSPRSSPISRPPPTPTPSRPHRPRPPPPLRLPSPPPCTKTQLLQILTTGLNATWFPLPPPTGRLPPQQRPLHHPTGHSHPQRQPPLPTGRRPPQRHQPLPTGRRPQQLQQPLLTGRRPLLHQQLIPIPTPFRPLLPPSSLSKISLQVQYI